MRLPIFVALALSFIWGVIGGSVGLNALIKANQEQSKFLNTAPAGVTVNIDVNDTYRSGIVLTTVCALIALLSLILLLLHLLESYKASPISASQSKTASSSLGGDSTRSLIVQAVLLGVCSLWLLATQIPFTLFFATRSAKVTAILNGLEVPQSLIQALQDAQGTTTIYHRIGYLRLVAILPWFTVFFTLAASVVLLVEALRTPKVETKKVTA